MHCLMFFPFCSFWSRLRWYGTCSWGIRRVPKVQLRWRWLMVGRCVLRGRRRVLWSWRGRIAPNSEDYWWWLSWRASIICWRHARRLFRTISWYSAALLRLMRSIEHLCTVLFFPTDRREVKWGLVPSTRYRRPSPIGFASLSFWQPNYWWESWKI